MKYEDVGPGTSVWLVCAIPDQGKPFGDLEIVPARVGFKVGRRPACPLRVGDADWTVWLDPISDCYVDDPGAVELRFPLAWYDTPDEAGKWTRHWRQHLWVVKEHKVARSVRELRRRLRDLLATYRSWAQVPVTERVAKSFDVLKNLDFVILNTHSETFGHGDYRDCPHLEGPVLRTVTQNLGEDGVPVVTQRYVSMDRLSGQDLCRIVAAARMAKVMR